VSPQTRTTQADDKAAAMDLAKQQITKLNLDLDPSVLARLRRTTTDSMYYRKQSAHTYKCIVEFVEEEPEAAFGYGTAKSAWPLFRKTDRST
jgi:hypothetical protein